MTEAVDRPLRVALIGCGFQGALHARCATASSSSVLVTCCDEDRDRAADLARSVEVDRFDSDADSVMSDPGVDAVIIATTTGSHADLAVAAARAGKHVLLEKPMATTVADCRRIEAAVTSAGVRMMIGFKFRFAPAVLAAREAVPSPVVVTAHTLYDAAQTTAGWLGDRAASGGRLTSSLVHAVDLLRFVTASEPVRVFAEGGVLAIEGIDEPDNAVATLRFANGTIGSIVHGSAGRSSLVSTWSFQLAGVGSNATVHDHGRRTRFHRAGQAPDRDEYIDPVTDPFAVGMAPMLEAFVTGVRTGVDPSPGPSDGTVSLAVCREIEAAIETGETRTISLPD